MSEDNKKKTTDKTIQITPDEKNAQSSRALPDKRVLSGEPDIDGASSGDDILEIIRRRKAAESKKKEKIAEPAPAPEGPASDISDIPEELFEEGLDHELSEPPKGEDTKFVDRATINDELEKSAIERRRTITVDKGASEEDKTRDDARWAVPDHEVDINDFFYHEPPEKTEETPEKTESSDKIKGSGEENKSEGSDSDGAGTAAKDASEAESDPYAESDALLQELVAEDPDTEESKRYGFKPYTREIKSMELAAAAEKAAAEKEQNSIGGKFKRMAKKRKSNSSGAKASGSKSSKSGGSSSKTGGSKTKSSGGKSKAARNSKTLSGVKVSKNTSAYKLKDLQSSSSGKPKKGGKTKKRTKKKQKSKFAVFFGTLIKTLIICFLIAGLAGTGYVAYTISHAPAIHPRNIYDTLDVSSHIYDDEENLVDEIYFSENRELVTFDQMPEDLTNAFIAVEDKTFWTHSGFNFRRIIGAILERFHGGRISGTSTITQQLARNVFLPDEKSVRSIKRKIIEMYYAYQIEQELSKEEIITAYLNTIYLGYGCYGVDTAARKYFATDVEGLTLEQCAALAALPQAPGSYALLTTEPTDITEEYANGVYINDASADRRNMILNLMYQQGMITKEEKEAATRPLSEFIHPGSSSSVSATSAFKDYLIETIKKDLMEEYGIEEEQAVKIIYTKGLNIYTTLNSQAQEVITEEFSDSDNFPEVEEGEGDVEAAMVLTEVGTGEIKAMVGTRSATGEMLFNRATNPRQPGSSIKPLSVYAPALQRSLEYHDEGTIFHYTNTGYDKQGTSGWGNYITVSSTVIDEPLYIDGNRWPNNVNNSFTGSNTFKSAIQKSINTCSVKILAQIGLEYSMDTLLRFGVTSAVTDTEKSVNDYNLASLGLGAMSYGISPLEMSAAYAVFANGGVRNTTICYTKVEDSGGRTLLESKSETVKVLDEGVAWIMNRVLQSVITQGIAKDAAIDGVDAGGKTGTTDNRNDIWFCGFVPNVSAALWIGTDDNAKLDSYGVKAAALWGDIMEDIDITYGGDYPERPDNVFRAWDGEYYTDGTAPEKPPEPEPEEDEAAKKAKDAKAKAEKTPSAAKKPAATPAPAPAATE